MANLPASGVPASFAGPVRHARLFTTPQRRPAPRKSPAKGPLPARVAGLSNAFVRCLPAANIFSVGLCHALCVALGTPLAIALRSIRGAFIGASRFRWFSGIRQKQHPPPTNPNPKNSHKPGSAGQCQLPSWLRHRSYCRLPSIVTAHRGKARPASAFGPRARTFSLRTTPAGRFALEAPPDPSAKKNAYYILFVRNANNPPPATP